MSDAAGAEGWSYDVLGRVVADRRTTSGVTKAFSYAYNLDGSLASLTYPSGRVVTYAYNGAGRALSAVDTVNGINYATGAAQGALASLQVGASAGFAGVTRTWTYNQRLQPEDISAASPTATVFSLTYDFDLGVANNGNVMRIVNNLDSGRTQSFTYDGLNRLQTAEAPTAWGLSYTYDRYGNLYTRTVTQGTATPLSLTVTSQNRLEDALDPGYYDYDAAGNMIKHGLQTYSYDAENRMTATAGVSHTYDGDGRRVRKSSGTLYWYGISGEVLVETDSAGNSPKELVFFGSQRVARRDSTGAVYYFFSDHLGSARLLTDSTGTVVEDSDFYPFGGERVVVSSLDNNYKFTGQERDAESGLDYFGARYYASPVARFTSTDPIFISLARIPEPQELNLYSYVGNNPLKFIDATGKYRVKVTEGGRTATVDHRIEKQTRKFLKNLPKGSRVTSSFRTTREQKDLKERYEAGEKDIYEPAEPGTSRHEAGLAVDVTGVMHPSDLDTQGLGF